MKLKKYILLIIFISIILFIIPTQSLAWLVKDIVYACNKINLCIAWILRIVGIIIAIAYISLSIGYLKYSKKEKKQKIKNILNWLIITVLQIAILFIGAFAVTEIGMEEYWYPTWERFQFSEIDGYISNGIRITALISIVAYIITSIIYFFKSKKENNQKIINIAKWQLITATLVAGLLVLATNW